MTDITKTLRTLRDLLAGAVPDPRAQVEQSLREWFTGRLLGQDILRAKLGELIYHCDGVVNYAITAPAADLPVNDDTLPVLGTLTVEEKP